MITKVSIKGFRGLNIEANLKKINVVIGKNGTGKTSFLEAIFLSSLFYSEYTENEINELVAYTFNSRGNTFSSYLTIEDTEILMWDGNEELKLIFKRKDPYTLNILYPDSKKPVANIIVENLKIRFPEGVNIPASWPFVRFKQKIIKRKEFPVYISTHFDSYSIPEKIVSYARNKGIKSNFEILQDAYGFYTLHEIKDNKAIPAYVIGRGLLKEELIRDSLSYASLLLADEIEDSLHPDMLIRVLKSIKESSTQVIFTTHSNEVIKFMTDIFEDNEVNIISLFKGGEYRIYPQMSLFKDLEKPLSWIGYL